MTVTLGTVGISRGTTTFAHQAPGSPSGTGGVQLMAIFWKGAVAEPTPDTAADWDGDGNFTQVNSNDYNCAVYWTDTASPDLDFTFGSAPTGAVCLPIRIDDGATGGSLDVAAEIYGAFSASDPYDPGNVANAPDGVVILATMNEAEADYSWNLGASTLLYSESNPTGQGFRLNDVIVDVLDAEGTAGGGTQDFSTIGRNGGSGHIEGMKIVVGTAAGGTTHTGTASLSGSATLAATGRAVRRGTASLSATATLTATGRVIRRGTVSLSGSATLAATGRKVARGSASLTGSATLTATGRVIRRSTASLTGTASLTATGSIVGGPKQGTASLSATATLAATGRKVARGTVSLSSSATLTATGRKVARGTVTLTGTATLTATGRNASGVPPVIRLETARLPQRVAAAAETIRFGNAVPV